MPYLSVVVPAYDEEARLLPTLRGLHEYYSAKDYTYDVLIVNDGSKDRTGAIVEEFARVHPSFRLLEYGANRGKGHAVKVGILASRGELILFCDADMATPQEETEKLLAHMREGADVAIGSRPLRESSLEIRQPLYREMLGRLFNKIVQVIGIRGIDDTQCGFKMFRREVGHEIFRRCKVNRFGFDFEALMIARDLGYRIDEVPIRWRHQEGSKVSLLRDGPRMLWDLLKLRMKGKSRRLELSEGL
ncbi:MAG TPA: dolichyl-phosphate beta-glucosyltransferase [Fimbriimonas sp.]|nr:dolichyl-phosphate beta-glucosyltransferase [Fimbriimonas sp.]